MSALRDVLADLGDSANRLGDLTPTIAEMLVAAVQDVFDAEGPGWAPLAPSTLAGRRGGGAGAKILQDTGVLVNSVSGDSGPDFAEAGSAVPYGAFHVTGTRRMPARDWLAVDLDALSDEVAELILAEVAG